MTHKRLRPSVIVVSIVVGLGLVTLLLWYGRRMSEVILPGASSARTPSMEPVELILRDSEDGQELRLRVPKAYLTRPENWRGGSQRFVRIETQLPALNPVPAVPRPPLPDAPEYPRWLAESNEGIYITLESNYVDRSDAATRERWLTTYSAARNGRSPVAYKLISADHFRLRGYRELACGPSDPGDVVSAREQKWECRDTPREYYVSNENLPVVRIFCDLNGATGIWRDRRGCQVSASFQGFALRYIFRYSQLSRWQEFDSAARKLLESFLVWEHDTRRTSVERRRAILQSDLNWFPANHHELRVKLQWLAIDAHNPQPLRIGPSGELIESNDVVLPFSVNNFGLQIRYRWTFAQQSDLYVVYGRGGFVFEEGESRDSDQLLVKARYRF